jgi:hypothetical protein
MSKDYEVGYRRPPRHTRFRKGTSGNPSGRPKKLPTPDELEQKVLLKDKVSTIENGKRRMVDPLTAALKVLRGQALKGDMRAMKLYLERTDARRKVLEAESRYEDPRAKQAEILVQAIRNTFGRGVDDDEGDSV